MKLLNNDIPVPPMPEPIAAPPADEPAEVASEPRRGRRPSPAPDERVAGFAKWLADTNRSLLTVGSYTAAVSAILRQGVAPDAHETALVSLELSPASLALYLRAWRNWLRYIGAAPLPAQMVKAKHAAAGLCHRAKGRGKPALADLKRVPWSSLKLLRIDGVPHFTLATDTREWLWEHTDENAAAISDLLEHAYGGPLPTDDAAYEHALETLSTNMVFA